MSHRNSTKWKFAGKLILFHSSSNFFFSIGDVSFQLAPKWCTYIPFECHNLKACKHDNKKALSEHENHNFLRLLMWCEKKKVVFLCWYFSNITFKFNFFMLSCNFKNRANRCIFNFFQFYFKLITKSFVNFLSSEYFQHVFLYYLFPHVNWLMEKNWS